MTTTTEYKGSRVIDKPQDASLMDSNWIHGPLGQHGGTTQKMVLEIGTILMIADDSILVGHETGAIGKVISLAFGAYVEHPKWRSYAIWTSI
jgi:hypothetical protein